jgi:hypothetical protein
MIKSLIKSLIRKLFSYFFLTQKEREAIIQLRELRSKGVIVHPSGNVSFESREAEQWWCEQMFLKGKEINDKIEERK